VLYQLSYCGGPCGASGGAENARAPDIGHGAALQELEGSARSESRGFGRKSRQIGLNLRSPSPSRQEAAPAAGLRLRRIGGLGEFVACRFIVDAWIVRRPHDWNDRRNWGCAIPGGVLAWTKYRGRRCFYGSWRR
jgi:hypothetical protein